MSQGGVPQAGLPRGHPWGTAPESRAAEVLPVGLSLEMTALGRGEGVPSLPLNCSSITFKPPWLGLGHRQP